MKKKILFLIPILAVLLSVSNVYAADYPPYGLQIPSKSTFYYGNQRLPYRVYGNASSSSQLAVSVFSVPGIELEKQSYIIFEVCTTDFMEFGISNASTDEAYINGKNVQYLVTDKRCSIYSENDSWKHLIYTEVGKWSVPSGGADNYYVDSYFVFNARKIAWSWTADITNIYITDTNTYEQDYANYQALRQNQTIINQNQATNDKLDDMLNADADASVNPDDSKYDDYESAEGSLKDKVNQADLSNLSIGIDSNSSKWIWETLTSLLQSHSAIFGMVIAILSIGIIKLALGR